MDDDFPIYKFGYFILIRVNLIFKLEIVLTTLIEEEKFIGWSHNTFFIL